MNAASVRKILAYWLVPAEPARSYFASLIAEYAKQFDAPSFEPHVTLYTAEAESDDADSVLRRALGGVHACCLTIAGIGHSQKFTKTLFVQFDPDDGVSALSTKIRSASAAQHSFELNPHLSLLYKTMTAEEKARLAGALAIPFAQVTFDSVKAIVSPGEIQSRADVEAWEVVAQRKLG